MIVAPKIEPFTFRDDYVEGQGLRQTCFVSSGDPPMLVSWFRDGQSVESSESVRITRIDEVTSLLAISDLTSQHAGNYSCVAKNEVAVVSVTARLVVKGKYAQSTFYFACNTFMHLHNHFLISTFFSSSNFISLIGNQIERKTTLSTVNNLLNIEYF